MIKKTFREHHLFTILSEYENQALPLDRFLKEYFHFHKAIGSKDRKILCENIYSIVRWKGLLDYLCDKPISWETRYQKLSQIKPDHFFDNAQIPLHIRLSFPKELFSLIVDSLGEEKARFFCRSSNSIAPITVRVNLLRTSRENLLKAWENELAATCGSFHTAIILPKRINFFTLPEFKMGHFEVQDEASQRLADLVAVKPGQLVLDFCAGSGGKSLAIAPKMQGKGQLFLHDIRKHVLIEAKKRLKRAGIQNAQILLPSSSQKKSLYEKFDWVFVDAPCSGTGTMRRNPDMKWRFTSKTFQKTLEEQRLIFEQALRFVKPGGHIVYMTCSVLRLENEEQTQYFKKTFSLNTISSAFSTLPLDSNDPDGFYGQVFVK
ncbi:MAG TPA: RsmB/NOP family class I SAM-dependent RNA methyltransferase [Candidatus Rhabdochlamydia sp.]|jgi:16S rRNA (cytosine967-C5)-methyltransferase|nr:RsmB/NOP family class I SAM-dependent RNA methyltransferase [Candidatus Rhabdochlamydia sp.]